MVGSDCCGRGVCRGVCTTTTTTSSRCDVVVALLFVRGCHFRWTTTRLNCATGSCNRRAWTQLQPLKSSRTRSLLRRPTIRRRCRTPPKRRCVFPCCGCIVACVRGVWCAVCGVRVRVRVWSPLPLPWRGDEYITRVRQVALAKLGSQINALTTVEANTRRNLRGAERQLATKVDAYKVQVRALTQRQRELEQNIQQVRTECS